MSKQITTTVEQAQQIVKAALDPKDDRYYWMIVADVMGLARDAAFCWRSVGSLSGQPNPHNQLVVTVDEGKQGFRS